LTDLPLPLLAKEGRRIILLSKEGKRIILLGKEGRAHVGWADDRKPINRE